MEKTDSMPVCVPVAAHADAEDMEPFCQTVRRWLEGDAPQECRGCEEGCWEQLHAMYMAMKKGE